MPWNLPATLGFTKFYIYIYIIDLLVSIFYLHKILKNIHLKTHCKKFRVMNIFVYVYIYIYICVCLCVRARTRVCVCIIYMEIFISPEKPGLFLRFVKE